MSMAIMDDDDDDNNTPANFASSICFTSQKYISTGSPVLFL